jgi:hypothetical protein
MRILRAIIEIAMRPMFHTGQDLALRGAIALQFIRDDHAWHVGQALQQLAEKLLRRFLVAAALHENIEHVTILIDGAPEIMPRAVDREQDLIQVPLVARLGAPATELIGIRLPELLAPLPDRFVGDGDSTSEQQLFDIAIAEAEAIVQPDAMADDRVRLNKSIKTAIDRDDREIVRFRFRFSSKKCLDIEPYFLLEKVAFAVFIALTGSAPRGQRFVELTCPWAASVGICMSFPHLIRPI